MKSVLSLFTVLFIALSVCYQSSAETIPVKRKGWFNRVSSYTCTSGDSSVQLNWDSGIAKLGPVSVIVNGEDIMFKNTVLLMRFDPTTHVETYYKDDNSFSITFPDSIYDTSLKVIPQQVIIGGNAVNMTCVYKSSYRFF